MEGRRTVPWKCEKCGSMFQLNANEAKRTGQRCRRFCSRRCSKFGSNNPKWKGDSITVGAGRNRAQERFPDLGQCQRCNRPATDRHHKDDNTANNDPSNIAFLCRICHMTIDGRLERLRIQVLTVNEAGVKASAAKRKAKTHCKRGHEFTPENTRVTSVGRNCIACVNWHSRQHYLANKVSILDRQAIARRLKKTGMV